MLLLPQNFGGIFPLPTASCSGFGVWIFCWRSNSSIWALFCNKHQSGVWSCKLHIGTYRLACHAAKSFTGKSVCQQYHGWEYCIISNRESILCLLMVAETTSVCKASSSYIPVFVCLENSTDGNVSARCQERLWRTSRARRVPGSPDMGESRKITGYLQRTLCTHFFANVSFSVGAEN